MCSIAGLGERRRHDIEANGAARAFGEGQCQRASATGDVEYAIAAAWAGGRDQKRDELEFAAAWDTVIGLRPAPELAVQGREALKVLI